MNEETSVLDKIEEEINSEFNKKLIVHNDEVNPFNFVIKALMEICDHSMEQAEQCTYIIHHKGKCSVKTGMKEELLIMRRELVSLNIGATVE